jgi:hypothetical protein
LTRKRCSRKDEHRIAQDSRRHYTHHEQSVNNIIIAFCTFILKKESNASINIKSEPGSVSGPFIKVAINPATQCRPKIFLKFLPAQNGNAR